MADQPGTITMQGVEFLFRNFSGRATQYTQQGRPDFSVVLTDEDLIAALREDGWNVKELKPRDEEEALNPKRFLPVKVRFDSFRPPTIVLITQRGRTNLDAETAGMLDWADVVNVDLIVNARPWTDDKDGGKTKITAYLKSLYVTIEEDDLAIKYSDLNMATIPPLGGQPVLPIEGDVR